MKTNINFALQGYRPDVAGALLTQASRGQLPPTGTDTLPAAWPLLEFEDTKPDKSTMFAGRTLLSGAWSERPVAGLPVSCELVSVGSSSTTVRPGLFGEGFFHFPPSQDREINFILKMQ